MRNIIPGTNRLRRRPGAGGPLRHLHRPLGHAGLHQVHQDGAAEVGGACLITSEYGWQRNNDDCSPFSSDTCS